MYEVQAIRKPTRNWLERLRRLTHLKLVIPLKRGRTPPHHIARGVAVGLAVGFTPTVGVQMVEVFLLWGLARMLSRRLDFHLVAAVAWVWVTNIFTMGPIYYGFLLTGQVMLGRFDELGSIGFDQFTHQLTAVVEADTGFIEALWVGTVALFKIWGIPLFLGSVPWAIGTAWLGYVWSKRFVERFRERRHHRRQSVLTARREKETSSSSPRP